MNYSSSISPHSDKLRVFTLASTPNPQTCVWFAKQDYMEGAVANVEPPSEKEAGEWVVNTLVKLKHFGPLEHPSIVFNVVGFPHSVMQQMRTHRTGCCLSGDTLIRFGHSCLSPGEKNSEVSLGHLADLWHNGRKHQRTASDAAYMQRQIASRHIQVLDTKKNLLVLSKITNIYRNGVKPIVKLISQGKEIKCTKDHLFWTNKGWKAVKEFDETTKVGRLDHFGVSQDPCEIEFTESDYNNEEWRNIEEYPFYQISSLGRVRSFMPKGGKQKNKDRVLIPKIRKLSKATYLFCSFSKEPGANTSKRENIHVLVCKAFHGNPMKTQEVRHLNGNKYDNRVENLVWGSSLENSSDLKEANEFAANRCKFFPVEILDLGESEETFDIEVEHDSHNFIANGFVTHNSFDVQSGRYTGKRVTKVVKGSLNIEDVFYYRPIGEYRDRSGKKYQYNEIQKTFDMNEDKRACLRYNDLILQGFSEEHARDCLPWSRIRQNFVLSCNLRALFHFFSMRSSKEAQLECQWLCDLMLSEALKWAPEIVDHYSVKHYGKSFIAP